MWSSDGRASSGAGPSRDPYGKVRAQGCAAFLPSRRTGYLCIEPGLIPAGRGRYLGIGGGPEPRGNSTIPSCIPESCAAGELTAAPRHDSHLALSDGL